MTGRHAPPAVEQAFRAACRAELEALKPGNVHVHAPGHGMMVADFLASAEVAAPPLAAAGATVGDRVLAAVEATRLAVGQNTNLGIVLLCAPLAAAAERDQALPTALAAVLGSLTRADAAAAFAAIRHANPGGLGHSEVHDVAEPPTVTLLEAMRSAAGRDRIARQYATVFVDVLGMGVPRLLDRRAAGWPESWAVTAVFLRFLASFPDTHIVRKHGPAIADEVRRAAGEAEAALLAATEPATVLPRLLALDTRLKSAGLNPGTSADLTVASHFAAALQ